MNNKIMKERFAGVLDLSLLLKILFDSFFFR
jgi:hypothetical protein